MKERTICSVCGTSVQEQKINYTQEIDGKLYLVTDVPAEVCPQCSEQYLSPDTVDKLQELIEQGAARGKAPKTISVPVYPFQSHTSSP